MHKHFIIFTLLILISMGCGRSVQKNTAPEKVETAAVKSIVMIEASERAKCLAEIRGTGATILYENELGLVMVDREVSLTECAATVEKNESEKLPAVPAKTRSLEELLALLPAEEIGARSFVKANPEMDGRGVIVAILDTGLELRHPILSTTTTGEPKIIDVMDVSGQGNISLEKISAPADGKITTSSGESFLFPEVTGDTFLFGKLLGKEVGGDEDERIEVADTAIVLVETAEKTVAYLDSNTDASFHDETPIEDFLIKRETVLLGKKKDLATAVRILKEEGGTRLVVFFDAGGHGTHVAGITAGYDPKGLTGTAPGAQLIGVKIGDNRLAGGSTTTASKMLAIDYAVSKGAKILNISYGIRSGTNVGKSAIDLYVDKVAKEKDVLFSISAGNEGPGLLTIGTPAAADLAFTVGAYVSKETAHKNYNYLHVEDDNVWYFSSVGPRLDGAFKPSILAPGSALSSLPIGTGGFETYRGTSMAAPHLSGGLALVVSAAKALKLSETRADITSAVLNSAVKVPGLKLVEQGHGLMSVPASVELLKTTKKTVEFAIAVESETSPDGQGKGIYVRSAEGPSNEYQVTVTPTFPKDTSAQEKSLYLRLAELKPSADFIVTNQTVYLNSLSRRLFVEIRDYASLKPGLHSESITATDKENGQVLFTIPVTIVKPEPVPVDTQIDVKVGHTERLFYNVPAGVTSLSLELESDGPQVWAQLLDPDGRKVVELNTLERREPQPLIRVVAEIARPGVYELDVVAPAFNRRTVRPQIRIQNRSLLVRKGAMTGASSFEVLLQNNGPAEFLKPSISIERLRKTQTVTVEGKSSIRFPFSWLDNDQSVFEGIDFTIRTAKKTYDLMTDYPYLIHCEDGSQIGDGGMELVTEIAIDREKLCSGTLHIEGAFAEKAPEKWSFEVEESRPLADSVSLHSGKTTLFHPGREVPIEVDLSAVQVPAREGFSPCLKIELEGELSQTVQSTELCI